jgi:hypothetical protein
MQCVLSTLRAWTPEIDQNTIISHNINNNNYKTYLRGFALVSPHRLGGSKRGEGGVT